MSMRKLFLMLKGGSGSGNFGHSGRPGKKGGSGAGRGYMGTSEIVEELGFHPIVEDLVKSYENDVSNWTMGANPDAKFSIDEHLRDKEVRTVSLYKLFNAEGNSNQTFGDFMDTPIKIYRGGRPEYGETFSNFTLSKSTAKDFSKKHGSGLFEAIIKPSEITGFVPTGATEVFIKEEGHKGIDRPRIKQIG